MRTFLTRSSSMRIAAAESSLMIALLQMARLTPTSGPTRAAAFFMSRAVGRYMKGTISRRSCTPVPFA
ncbi:MAG: hypothetical protein OXJ64_05535 [Boseongicola sp.]|nr:hypothetical protein [Boseongicola sp.]